MDDTTSTSSASSSASDSDAYNTESARLYFGPVKTPERKFVANNRRLPPLQVPHSLRRSPRLSSPRPPLNALSTLDQESAAQEDRDIDLVAELVNEVEVEDDEQMSYPLLGTPQRLEELEQDEPLSALADKILHAVDNPSPPPSPAMALKMFDPYHPANSTDSGEYEGDLFPHVTQGPTLQDNYPLIKFPGSSDARKLEAVLDQDLIVFDSPNQFPSFNRISPLNVSQQPMSVDDLLADSPNPSVLDQPSLNREPTILIDEPTSGGVDGDIMSVDSPNNSPGEGQLAFDHSSETQERHVHEEPHFGLPIQPAFGEDAIVTPLRRSTRPRKSVGPTPSPQPPPVVTPLPSIARTSVKKDSLRNLDEDNQDNDRKSPSRTLPSTPRSRSRSPSKEPFSFHREVGSLSPASASVLSSLAFNSIDIPEQTSDSSSSRPAIGALSFSVFGPSGGTSDALSTPVRTDGPKRVPSPQKVEVSPRKFRVQSPAPNGPPNTPARRILIEQAIAEGQLSPEKAAKIGFKANNGNSTPSVVSTPARRVPISEKHAIPSRKPGVPGLESPVKQLATHKGPLTVPPRHAVPSLKGKEKAVAPAFLGTSASAIKPGTLPFPIVAATLATIGSQEPVAKKLPKSESSPAKSTLKVTSKIPRINKKPYTRNVPASVTSSKLADSGKSTFTAKRPIRLVESANISVNPVSRPKPTVSTMSTSTVLLKRKREENLSPSKPRPTVLRQVPPLTTRPLPGSSKTQTTDDGPTPPPDQQIHDTIWVRRVVTPPLPALPVPEPHHEDPTVDNLRLQSEAIEPSSSLEGNDLPPASPMKQDPPELQQSELVGNLPSGPVSVAAPLPVSGTPGLRRTTRPRRPVHSNNETVPRKTIRRKVVAPQFDDVFSGMSITALKELTMTNTEKNQHYVAAKLETEVVRKVGLRPESPAVKIRTVVQRQQEEKEQQRTERAKRRARRSRDDDGSTSDIEASSDVGYSSPTDHIEDMDMDTNFDVGPRHRRGAGDDEDYETPERPLRDLRARLFDHGSGGGPPDRRVKWDRSLFSLVYLDEVKLGSRQNLKENRALKSILAPAAKAVRLDTLGNLLHADIPLTDLVPENVTVKKFVYDNDVTPATDPPAPKTRSKSKRK